MQPSFLTDVLLPFALALIMMGMGVTLTLDDFRRVVRYPTAAIVGLVAQILVLPLIGFMLVKLLGLPYGLGVGLMILALCPGGPTASLITFLARGDAALSVTLTATSSVITIVTTPLGLSLVLEAMARQNPGAIHLNPLQTIGALFLITIIPVAAGMAIRAKKPGTAAGLETPFKLFGLIVLVAVIFAALLRERNNIVSFFAQAGVAALLLNVLALGAGAGLAWLARLNKPQTVCIAIDTGNCNGTLSIFIAATILRNPEMSIAPAVYSLLMLIVGGAAVFAAPRLGRRILKSESLGATTVPDILARAIVKFPTSTAHLIPEKAEFRPMTYTELSDRVRRYATVLDGYGLKRGDRVAILAENCAAWAHADWAVQSLGFVSVPIFPTLPADTVQYILEDAGAKLLIAGSAEQERKATGITTIRLGDLEKHALAAAPMDPAAWASRFASVQPDDLSTLIYTSGTTGQPKGVMLTHRNFTYVCDAARKNLPFDQNEVFLSFLPMSHIYERAAGQMLPVSLGAAVAYSRGLAGLAQDMQTVKPSVMLCVPRFLEATMDRIIGNAEKLPKLDKWLFDRAIDQGVRKARGGFAPFAPVLDVLVLANVRDRLGGHFRFFASGGAALPKHVAEFYLAIGINILQGYGLTETTGATFINRPNRNKYWTVGESLDMETKIAEDGEILIRGPGVMAGYYNLPDATREAIDADGWFHTGDIGEWEGPALKITDRKKDLFKLSNGKYVAPQPLENKLKESHWIQEAVVFGDGQDMVTALIIPNWAGAKEHLGIEGDEEKLVDDTKVRALIKQDVDALNKSLPPHELVKRFTLLPKAFSVDGGELTPTLKVKRRVVRERFAALLEAMR